MQFGRFSPLGEQTYRNHFEKKFDFFSFNKLFISYVASDELVVTFDPGFIPKSGKATYGRGKMENELPPDNNFDLQSAHSSLGFAIQFISD